MAISTGAHSRNLPTSLQICKGRAEHSTSKTQKIVMSRRSLEMLVVQRFIITTFWLWNLIILDPTRTYKDSIEICGNWSWGASFTSKKQLPFSIWSEFSLAGWLPALMKPLLRWWRSLSCIKICIAPGPSSFLSETSGLPTLSSNSKITVNH